MRKLTLRTELILVALAVLIPVAALSMWQGLASHKYTTALLDDRLVIGALAVAERQREEFVAAERALLVLSQNEEVRTIGPGCSEQLKPGLMANAAVLNIVRADATGSVRCSLIPYEPGMTLANEGWWRRGIERKTFTVTAPTVGAIVKQQMVIGMLPIYTAQGLNDGSISIGIDYNQLQRSFEGLLADNLDAARIVTVAPGQVVVTSSAGPLPAFQPSLASGRVSEATSRDGVVWKYAAAPVFGGTYYAIYARPKHELSASATWLVWDNLAFPLLAVLLTALAIWIATSRLIVNWLAALIKLAGEFAAGNYRGDAEKFQKAPSEIAALSDSLHAMAAAIGQRDQQLQAALIGKTRMTMEIHHRVKNNLQMVSSLLHLQTRRIDDLAARASLDQTRARIGALAEIHRLLYEEGNDSPDGMVETGPLLGKLCTQMSALHRHQENVELHCHIADHTVSIDAAIPLSLFAVEAITNAYRYAFPSDRGGTIEFVFKVAEGECRLRIADDGVGFDRNDVPTSMGSQLMNGFAEQLGGRCDITSAPGSGTEVALAFSTDRYLGAPKLN